MLFSLWTKSGRDEEKIKLKQEQFEKLITLPRFSFATRSPGEKALEQNLLKQKSGRTMVKFSSRCQTKSGRDEGKIPKSVKIKSVARHCVIF